MTEAGLKRTITEYLDILMTQGILYWDRLNSGDYIEVRGDTRRRVKGCRKGTADLFILKDGRIIFCELKGEKGRVTPEQLGFADRVQAQGAEWHIVWDLSELRGILGLGVRG